MAWTTPTVRATGDLITAAIWNGDVVSNLKFLYRVTGQVSSAGAVVAGTGFTCSKAGTGIYNVSFTTAFASAPVVVVGYGPDNPATFKGAICSVVATTGFTALTGSGGTAADSPFMFVAETPS